MPFYDELAGKIVVTIVYDGPELSGKTTNLRHLCTFFTTRRRSEVVTPHEQEGRTSYFDWLRLEAGVVQGYSIRCHLYTVPGQIELNARRSMLLDLADVVVFVCESTPSGVTTAKLRYTSIRNHAKPEVPVVVQANKQDLPDALTIDEIADRLGVEVVNVLPARAREGIGVRETAVLSIRAAADQLQAHLLEHGVGSLPTEIPTTDELHEAMLARQGEATTGVALQLLSDQSDDDLFDDRDIDVPEPSHASTLSETEPTQSSLETEAAETEAVETEAVETEAAETEAVETEAVEIEAVEIEAVETEAMETEAVEAAPAEIEAAEIEAVETGSVETAPAETLTEPAAAEPPAPAGYEHPRAPAAGASQGVVSKIDDTPISTPTWRPDPSSEATPAAPAAWRESADLEDAHLATGEGDARSDLVPGPFTATARQGLRRGTQSETDPQVPAAWRRWSDDEDDARTQNAHRAAEPPSLQSYLDEPSRNESSYGMSAFPPVEPASSSSRLDPPVLGYPPEARSEDDDPSVPLSESEAGSAIAEEADRKEPSARGDGSAYRVTADFRGERFFGSATPSRASDSGASEGAANDEEAEPVSTEAEASGLLDDRDVEEVAAFDAPTSHEAPEDPPSVAPAETEDPPWRALTPEANASAEPATEDDPSSSNQGADPSGALDAAEMTFTNGPVVWPTARVPSGYIWPGFRGRERLDSLRFEKAVARPDLVGQQGDNDGSGRSDVWIFELDGWCVKTSDRRFFHDSDEARTALAHLARAKLSLGDLLLPETVLALAPDGAGMRMWTIAPWRTTLRSLMNDASRNGDEDALTQALVKFAAAVVSSIQLVAARGVVIDVNPSNFCCDEDQLGYVDDDIGMGSKMPALGHALLRRVGEYERFPSSIDGYLSALEGEFRRNFSRSMLAAVGFRESLAQTMVMGEASNAARDRLLAFVDYSLTP